MKTLVGLSLALTLLSGCGAECPPGTRAAYFSRNIGGKWVGVRECVTVFEPPTLPKVEWTLPPPKMVWPPPDLKLPRRDR